MLGSVCDSSLASALLVFTFPSAVLIICWPQLVQSWLQHFCLGLVMVRYVNQWSSVSVWCGIQQVQPCPAGTRSWCRARPLRRTRTMRSTSPPCLLPSPPPQGSRSASERLHNSTACYEIQVFTVCLRMLAGSWGGVWDGQRRRGGGGREQVQQNLHCEPAEQRDPEERPAATHSGQRSSWYTVGGGGQAQPHPQAPRWVVRFTAPWPGGHGAGLFISFFILFFDV